MEHFGTQTTWTPQPTVVSHPWLCHAWPKGPAGFSGTSSGTWYVSIAAGEWGVVSTRSEAEAQIGKKRAKTGGVIASGVFLVNSSPLALAESREALNQYVKTR
jgi:hypothetical protein